MFALYNRVYPTETPINLPMPKVSAAAGMIDLIRKGFFKRDETVLP